ncbi:TRZ/ATZ family hydrolase [Pseudothauera nasutitermitis]|uniref:5-methylthioadenosine/S-adenosylhomocysteine deaminase n=1 Tax=Pseudothauera nasutitermitis TaxID=2565930 RepID=A0A4S4B4D2_9RHOO|nr:TRZ/ATZ family hydrolase [Pseudothauera nasutitermitis]THF65784.1 TRZ/ATZ family hydrolase [Pseudothauera nasutitermitis]
MSDIADLLLHARWVVPVEPHGTTLEHHTVAVRDGRILALLPQEEARRLYPQVQAVELPHHVLFPGFVNLHVHAAMALMRGIADDLPLMRWLQEAIWPTEGRHVSPAFVRDGTLLAAAEMLRGGITTCNDMYFYPEAAAQAFDEAGMRAVLGTVVLAFPTPYASDADDYLRKGLAVRDQWRGHPRIDFTLAPHAPYTVDDDTLKRVAALAAEIETPIHIHIHETVQEVTDSITQHGVRPLTRLERLGLLGANFIGVHAVHLDETEIALLAHHGCAVAHCPTSNMKLASGAAPAAALRAAGVTVGLGTDGAASNNRMDMFAEMRHASLLAKVTSGDATALPASEVLRMATLEGARALGMAERIGSIEPGKQADLCAVALDTPETRPCFDPVSHLVYVAGREHVSHVWVDGEARLDKGKSLLQTSDKELLRLAAVWQTKLVN